MEVFFRNKHDAREQKHTHTYTHLIELSRIELWPFMKSEVAVELVRLISICFVVCFFGRLFVFVFLFLCVFLSWSHIASNQIAKIYTHTRTLLMFGIPTTTTTTTTRTGSNQLCKQNITLECVMIIIYLKCKNDECVLS